MALQTIAQVIEAAKSKGDPARLAVVCADEQTTLEAVLQAYHDGIIDPILIGDAARISQISKELGETAQLCVYDIADHSAAAAFGVELVRRGEADFLMKGLLHTAQFLKAVLNKETGLPNSGVISHFALVELPEYHKLLAVSDVGIVIQPTLEQKVAIIQNALPLLHGLGYDMPKIAVLTAVEEVKDSMPETVHAQKLKEMNQANELTGCLIEGPISFDLTFSRTVAEIKGYDSPIVGDPDMLLVPSVVAGNLMVKAMRQFGHSKSIALALGASVPLVVTSRGSTTYNKYQSIALAAASINRTK